jgi:hypothetical protein
MSRRILLAHLAPALAFAFAFDAHAVPFLFSTGAPDDRMATATRPDTATAFEIESADDFLAPEPVTLTGATFTGLLTNGATLADVGQVRVEIYRVFPNDSQDPPSGNVPTRMNSPSDVAFADRDTAVGDMLSAATILSPQVSAANSVQPGGIHVHTGGDGAVTGQEVQFTVSFDPLSLPADHYFFVPQVETKTGEFLWLSAPKPITEGTGPFNPDLQTWTRDASLDPDWLRVGTDVVDGEVPPTFNASFSLVGQTVPEPGTALLVSLGLVGLARRRSVHDSSVSAGS